MTVVHFGHRFTVERGAGHVQTSHDGASKCDCRKCSAVDVSRDTDAVNRAVAALYPALAKHGGLCTEAMREVLAAATGGLDECANCGDSTAVGTPDPHVCGAIGGVA